MYSFNPRPREGSDPIWHTYTRVTSSFNPRPREGSDEQGCSCNRRRTSFNPRPREGSDPASDLNIPDDTTFQSTPP